MKKKTLEKLLQTLPPIPEPKAMLEQYTTPAPIVADVVYTALGYGDVDGKTVGDFGCGTGRFAVAAKLLGAKTVHAIDIDARGIEIGQKWCSEHSLNINFYVMDIRHFNKRLDTVFQNPPFGSQQKHADLPFIEKGLEVAEALYTFINPPTRRFIEKLIKSHGRRVTYEKNYKFEMKYMFAFHKKEKIDIEVTLLRVR